MGARIRELLVEGHLFLCFQPLYKWTGREAMPSEQICATHRCYKRLGATIRCCTERSPRGGSAHRNATNIGML